MEEGRAGRLEEGGHQRWGWGEPPGVRCVRKGKDMHWSTLLV